MTGGIGAPPFATCVGERLRQALRQIPAAVAIVSAGRGAEALGITATSVTPVSLAPPTILACVNNALRLNTAIRASARFEISYLRRDQESVARAFSGAVASAERFSVGGWDINAEGGPLLPTALLGVSCRLEEILSFGAHNVFVGQVEAVRAASGPPLVYRDGRYGGSPSD